jgi:hypothetical protein
MESNSANVPSTKGSAGVEAAGKAGERETNAPNLSKAPQAAEERETNAPCPREIAENAGTRETNVSEKDAAVARRDGGPPAIAGQLQQQGVAAVNKPPNQVQKEAAITAIPQTASPDPGDGGKSEGVGPTYPTPPELERQQARLAGVVRPAAGDACDVS